MLTYFNVDRSIFSLIWTHSPSSIIVRKYFFFYQFYWCIFILLKNILFNVFSANGRYILFPLYNDTAILAFSPLECKGIFFYFQTNSLLVVVLFEFSTYLFNNPHVWNCTHQLSIYQFKMKMRFGCLFKSSLDKLVSCTWFHSTGGSIWVVNFPDKWLHFILFCSPYDSIKCWRNLLTKVEELN